MTGDGYASLCHHLGHPFQRTELLERALTHRSFQKENNERLEFLGDAILGMIIAEALFERYPKAKEGELSRLRAALVKAETLAELGRGFELGQYLRLGSGELKSGGFRRESILADALEAIIGAIYLDGGMERCRKCILSWYAARFDVLEPNVALKDPKTRLQEHLQARRLELPAYRIVDIAGQDHAQMFRVECRIAALGLVSYGSGSSRRRAEQDAAQQALSRVDHE